MARRALSCGRLAAVAAVAALLQLAGLALFVFGFFPVKPTLQGFSGPESFRSPSCDSSAEETLLPPLPQPDQLKALYRELSATPPLYDRLIMMVVDGLPAEFVLGRGDMPPDTDMVKAMPYTQSLLKSRKAIGYHTKAAPPTVTMPRLKAMVSGAIGGFLDVAFNFNTQAFLDDNLLDQFYRIGWKLVMLGDETWIKMFPHLFFRKDGVSSFYVKDTIQVDFNVSRHLDFELTSDGWDLLVLHYLGLDHVGHIGGRKSSLMIPKLTEMDEIVRKIHTHSILGSRTLLVVLSDHGMTDGGNHGGSSYEETDALALFVGYSVEGYDHTTAEDLAVLQVDVTPTLALLFGVPIPKNSIGVLLPELFSCLQDDQRLRSFQLNSWQLLSLLNVYMPGMHCATNCEGTSTADKMKDTLCHLYSKALASLDLWHLHRDSASEPDDKHLASALQAYYNFSKSASNWLSRRATDKPFHLIIYAVSLMVISCILFLGICSQLFHNINTEPVQNNSQQKAAPPHMSVDEGFVIFAIILHALSLSSSSFVEEEQYTWHFMTSTLYLLFLLKTVQSFLREQYSQSTEQLGNQSPKTCTEGNTSFIYKFTGSSCGIFRLSILLLILLLGRIAKAWHQGGVNWSHLPDIAKFITHAGTSIMKLLQTISLLAIPILYAIVLSLVRMRKKFIVTVWLCHLFAAFFVLLHIQKSQLDSSMPIHPSNTKLVKIFYSIGITSVLSTVLVCPWLLPISQRRKQQVPKLGSRQNSQTVSKSGAGQQPAIQNECILASIRQCIYLIGATYTAFWCLLQLLLQQPINALPVLLIYVQILLSIVYFSNTGLRHKQWVEVAAFQFLGMAGHFSLGNSNSLATVDVAGAFIGTSSFSAILSGILMFIITYASPLLASLGSLMYLPFLDVGDTTIFNTYGWRATVKKMMALLCSIPLLANSVFLTSFTIILLLMRNHLFIWSVFSPKYLYACAATVSVYAGVFIVGITVLYVCAVFTFRTRTLQI